MFTNMTVTCVSAGLVIGDGSVFNCNNVNSLVAAVPKAVIVMAVCFTVLMLTSVCLRASFPKAFIVKTLQEAALAAVNEDFMDQTVNISTNAPASLQATY